MVVSTEQSRKNKIARGRTSEGAPNPIDVYVGCRIRERRTFLKISQEEMGEILGISYQQIQKYEKGDNRISASRLWDLAQVLEVSVEYFFAGMDKETVSRSPRKLQQNI